MEVLKAEREKWLAGHDAEIRKANHELAALRQSVQVCCHLAYQHMSAFNLQNRYPDEKAR